MIFEYYEKKQENQSKTWILNAEEKKKVTKNSDNTLTNVNEISGTKEITEGQEATKFTPYLKRLNLLPYRDI